MEQPNVEYYPCHCGTANHYVHLSFDSWDNDGYIAIGVGTNAKGFVHRIREAVAVLRGEREVYDEVVLHPEAVKRLHSDLSRVLTDTSSH